MSDGPNADIIALAKWQGETDAGMKENARRLGKVSDTVDKLRQELGQLRGEVQELKASVRVWSTLGAMVGAGVVSFIVGKIG